MLTKKRAVLAALAATAMALTMGACSSGDKKDDAASSDTTAAAGTDEGGTGTAAASVWYLSGQPKEGIWANSFAEWTTEHPEAPINAEMYANDQYKEKIRTAIGAGTAPTLVFSWGAFGPVAEYVEANQIISLDGKVDEAMSRVLPSVGDAGKIDGVQYAVPNGDAQPVMLFYNKDLFEQAGVEAPIETWDELLASFDKFKAIGVAPFALAGGSKWPDLMWLEYLADRVGGPEAFNAVIAGEAGAWSNPDMITALTYIQDLVAADGFQADFTSTLADANADVALVYSGKAAMLLQGSWVYGSFKADAPDFVSSGKLGSFPFPTVEGGKGDKGNIAGNPSNFWSINSDATPEEQATALAWLNEKNLNEEMVDALIAGGAIPPVADAQAKLEASDDAAFLMEAYTLLLEAPHFQASWDQVIPSDDAQELLTNLDKIFLGQITPEEFASNMDKTL
ncbi:MAG: extracellular solute-binding protein [Bifidobacteriaceae bacterium]|jgi:raffinose/stachyose/melibiose transport system substrate-binding protein|nr:extracellular solute-binding protein [Bifidobacteriaceae bacterium]